MKKYIAICTFAVALICSSCAVLRPSHLRTDLMEFTDTSFGGGRMALITSSSPQFSWVVPATGDSTMQVAYKIVLSELYPLQPNTDSFGLVAKPVWNSGWVNSPQSVAVPYTGPALKPGKRYEWSLQLRVSQAAGKRLKTIKNASKRFRTADALCDYATPAYPLIEKRQEAKVIENGVFDFEKAAFGKLELTLMAEADDSIMVVIGERLKNGRIEHTPRVSSVVYDEIPLAVKKGTHKYLVEPNRNGRNTGPQAVPVPDYAGVVAPFRYCEIHGAVSYLKVERISYHYPFDQNAATFRCSNDTLNAIWDLCHYSLE